MTSDEWLDAKYREACPSDNELQAVAQALDKVEDCLEREGGPLRIAQRYRCGSYAKSTMLTGRREADLVIVLREAPTDQTLDQMRTILVQGTSPSSSEIHYKAIALGFADGVSVDVLPVAKVGITEPSPSVPAKLRHALSGPMHVDWFRREAHGTTIHPTVRLLKLFRGSHPAWRKLSSFKIEVLAVDALKGHEDGLVNHFQGMLTKVAEGYLKGKVLLDPADDQNDLLEGMTEEERSSIADEARSALRFIADSTWSAVFQSATAALPSSNLGGRTLA
jgi:hypothetical protein